MDRAAPATMRSVLATEAPRAVVLFRSLWVVSATVAVSMAAATRLISAAQVGVAAASIAWVVVAIVVTHQAPRTAVPVALIDVGLFAGLLVAASMLSPPKLVGDGTTWIGTGASVSALVAGWLLPMWRAAVATLVIVAGYLSGLALTGSTGSGEPLFSSNHVTTTAQLLLQGGLGIASVALIRRSTSHADDALVRRVGTERVSYVERRRSRRLREQARVLHDDVQNTLWLLGDYLIGANARRRAIEATHHLRELRAGRLPPPRTADLTEAIRAVCATAIFTVDLHIAPWREVDGTLGFDPPAVVVDAVATAVREALANAATHAGVDRATVGIVRGPNRLAVTVQDRGTGFDSRAETDGQGIRQSIRATMTEVGGTAALTTTPGLGTTWTLSWAGAQIPSPPAAVRGAVAAEYKRGFRGVYMLIAAGFHAFSLYHLLTREPDYRAVGLAAACWIAMLFAGVVLIAGIDRPWMSSGIARAAVVTVIVASVTVAVSCQPWGVAGFANWGVGEFGWFLALATAHLRTAELLAYWVVAAFVNTAAVVTLGGDDPFVLVKAIGIVIGYAVLQVGASIAFTTMRSEASRAAEQTWHASEVQANRDVEEAAERHRAELLKIVDDRTQALLESIADGTADPANARVALECRESALIMRYCGSLQRNHALDLVPLVTEPVKAGFRFRLSLTDGLDTMPVATRTGVVTTLLGVLSAARPGESILAVQRDVVLAGSDRPLTLPGALSVSLTVPIEPGAGPWIRRQLLCPPGLDVSLELYDNEAMPGDESATSAWVSLAYRP
jgi:hypothetical protein